MSFYGNQCYFNNQRVILTCCKFHPYYSYISFQINQIVSVLKAAFSFSSKSQSRTPKFRSMFEKSGFDLSWPVLIWNLQPRIICGILQTMGFRQNILPQCPGLIYVVFKQPCNTTIKVLVRNLQEKYLCYLKVGKFYLMQKALNTNEKRCQAILK